MNLEKIKQEICIVSYLKLIGCKPQSENEYTAMFLAPYRSDSKPSLSINKTTNLWFDHSLGKGGSIIDLLSMIDNCSIADAISKLERESLSFSFRCNKDISSEIKREVDSLRGIKIIAKKELSHPALIRYVESRNISKEVAKNYLSEAKYSINGKGCYFSLSFKNNSGGQELRNRYFKNCTGKDITFIDNQSDILNVFEGFFDFLSYLEFNKNEGSTKKENYLILNSTAMKNRAIPVLKNHSEINLFLDNDDTGTRLTDELKNEFQNSVKDCRSIYKGYKDFNEFWIDYNLKQRVKYRR